MFPDFEQLYGSLKFKCRTGHTLLYNHSDLFRDAGAIPLLLHKDALAEQELPHVKVFLTIWGISGFLYAIFFL